MRKHCNARNRIQVVGIVLNRPENDYTNALGK